MPVALSAKWNGPTQTPLGTPYTGTVEAKGGTSPYRFTKEGGALPDGLSVDRSTGKIIGTPNVAGSFSFGVLVSDAASQTTMARCSIAVSPAQTPDARPPATGGVPAPSAATPSAPGAAALSAHWEGPTSATVGEPYQGAIKATGGQTPYVFVRENGGLPEGLKLETGSGKITGTPRDSGNFSYAVKVSDAGGETFIVGCPIAVDS